MARRKSFFGELLENLYDYPWWVSSVVAIGGFLFFKYVLPEIPVQSPATKGFIMDVAHIAPFVCLSLLIPAPISFYNSMRKRHLFNKQSDIESIQSLSWKEFEELTGEAFRRQGHKVAENRHPGPDGGVDLVLRKDEKSFLVQCKHWNSHKVGVRVVREMFGVMTAKDADGVYIVTSGKFTQEAQSFANGKPIKLIEGEELSTLINEIKNEKIPVGQEVVPLEPVRANFSKLLCAKCGSVMVSKTAGKGSHPGKEFWGCSTFPRCSHVEAMK